MENKKTITHLWPDKLGKPHYPVQTMDAVHLRSAYRLCWLRVYLSNEHKSITDEQSKAWGLFVTKEQADKWILIFKEEAARRKMMIKKPNEIHYKAWLDQRQSKKFFKQESFNKIIGYDQRTNSFDIP